MHQFFILRSIIENRKFEENKMQKEESINSFNISETVEEIFGKDPLNIKDNILCKQDKRIENSNHDYEEGNFLSYLISFN